MLLRRFYDAKLAQASYLVGCQSTGEALVIDAARDPKPYLDAARSEGLRVAHVTETHIHADYVSGSRELARAAGARLYLSGEGGPDWTYGFAASDGATVLKDGDVLRVGNVRVEVMHTPGHTPEHLSFMVTDARATERPMGVFTGDFVFVGDVGRPDLLEKAAGIAGTMVVSARQLFRSLQRFKQLPDYLQVWPAHGAGSACGKALGAVPSSTVGYERFANWGLVTNNEDAFVQMVLEGQPEPPPYFAHMKRINRDGPPLLGNAPMPRKLDAGRLDAVRQSGALIVDTRGTAAYAGRHLAGSLNVPLGPSFTSYAGQVLPYDRALVLVVDEQRRGGIREAVWALRSIGLDRVDGVFGLDVMSAGSTETIPQLPPAAVAARLERGEVVLLDVRARTEWDAGYIGGARHMPLTSLVASLEGLPRDAVIVCQCETGSRSAVAASVLRAHGFARVANLTGGITAWQREGRLVSWERPAHVD